MRINRDFYLNQLIDALNNGMIKVITVIRSIGKSYLLFELFYDYLLNDSSDYLELIGKDLLDLRLTNKKSRRKKI